MERYLSRFDPENMVKVAEGISLNPWLSDGLLDKLGISVLDIHFSRETPYHYHEKTQEFFRFYTNGKVIFDGNEFEVHENSTLYIPVKAKHKLIPENVLKATLITVPKFDPSDEYIVK